MYKSNQKESNKENLLSRGVTLLLEQGYHGTGLQEILDAANIPKGSFYNYFGSKENFGAEVVQHYIEPFITQLDTHLRYAEDNALGAIRRYFNELIVTLEKNEFSGGCLLGNLMGEMSNTSDICQKSLQSAMSRYRDLLQLGLEKAQQQGTIRSDKSAKDMADLLINTWQGSLLRMKVEKSSLPLKQCCQDLLGDYLKA